MAYVQYQGSPDVFTDTGQYVSAEQAAAIPNFFSQVQQIASTRPDVTTATDFAKVSGTNIPVAMTQPTGKLPITTPTTSDIAGATVAGANASVDAYNKNLALVQGGAPSKTQQQYDLITKEINDLLPSSAGRSHAQIAAEDAAGVAALNKDLANVNAQILSKTAEYNKLATDLEGKPVTMNSIIGAEAQVRKAQASEIGLLQSIALGKQGMVEAAQQAADRAVKLKYDDIDAQIKMKLDQLKLIEPMLTREEKIRADALKLTLEQQKEASDTQKDNATKFQNVKITALGNNMPVGTAQQAQSLYDAGRTDEAYAIMNKYTGARSADTSSVTQETKNQTAAVNLYGSTITAAMRAGANPNEAVLAAAAIADQSGTKLSLTEQNALLQYAQNNYKAPVNPATFPSKLFPTSGTISGTPTSSSSSGSTGGLIDSISNFLFGSK